MSGHHPRPGPYRESVNPAGRAGEGRNPAERGPGPSARRRPAAPDPAPDPGSTPSAATSPAEPGTGQPKPGLAAERLAYSVDEAAALTGLSRDLLYDQMRRGNLSYLKIGRRRLITRQHLQQFLGAAS
jgi:excisionase family DNA binding protein